MNILAKSVFHILPLKWFVSITMGYIFLFIDVYSFETGLMAFIAVLRALLMSYKELDLSTSSVG